MRTTLAQCEPQRNPIFIRATPWQRGFAAKCPVHKFRCVFLQNRALGPGGGQFVIFGLFCCCHTFPLKCLFLLCEKAVPEPAFRWTPNRPVFEETRSPWQPSGIYIYIHIHIHSLIQETFFFRRVGAPNSAEVLETTVFCPNPISPIFLEMPISVVFWACMGEVACQTS